MSTRAIAARLPRRRPPVRSRPIGDALAITWRNLVVLGRTPQLLVFATVQPLIFVLLFRYAFGGSIHVPGVDYVDYLIPGVFAQIVAFGAIQTGIGLSYDKSGGMIERLRSLPMARSAVLAGRAAADLVRNVLVVAVMLGVGFAVGFRIHTDAAKLVLALLLLLAFGVALSLVFAFIGLSASSPESAQAASFPITIPLIFASSAFVATATMPAPLRAFADHQPVTAVVNAVRALALGGPWGERALISLAWTAGLAAVFGLLAVRAYRRAA